MGDEWGTLPLSSLCARHLPLCPVAPAWRPFRSSSGTFGPALRPGSSTGTLNHVMVRGIERRPLAPRLGISPRAVYAAAQQGAQYRAEWDHLVPKSQKRQMRQRPVRNVP